MDSELSVQDRQAVETLVARYNWAFDEGDAESWAALWTPDGRFEGNGDTVSGHEALKALVTDSFTALGGQTRHHATNIVTAYGATPDEIEARAYNLVTDWKDGGRLFALALSRLTLVRQSGSWRIRSNRVELKLA